MKDKLRSEVKKQRKKLNKKEIKKKSKQIIDKLIDLKEYRDAETVLFYISYNGEVFTHELVKEALKKKTVVVPISNLELGTLTISKIKKWNDLEKGAYGILEPKISCVDEVSIFDIDCIIVPGIAFDEHGCRLGHGIGYYDKLLQEATNAFHIGLAYEFQIVEKVPVKPHDIPVHKILTEERVIDCLSYI